MSLLYHNRDLRQAAPVTAATAWSSTPIWKEYGTWRRYVAYRYRQLRNLTREQTDIITLRLGNGCSAAATRAGNSVDASMGLTPLEGPVMGTWSGGLDPAIVDFIATKERLSSREVEGLLNTQSGLIGVSGLTNDMRELLDETREHKDRRAMLAIEIFCYRIRKYIGAYLVAMAGADAVVFTGGIGENSATAARDKIAGGAKFSPPAARESSRGDDAYKSAHS